MQEILLLVIEHPQVFGGDMASCWQIILKEHRERKFCICNFSVSLRSLKKHKEIWKYTYMYINKFDRIILSVDSNYKNLGFKKVIKFVLYTGKKESIHTGSKNRFTDVE